MANYYSKRIGLYAEEKSAVEAQKRIDQAEDAQLKDEHCILEWTSLNGQAVEVWVWDDASVMVKVGTKEYWDQVFSPAPINTPGYC